MLYSAEKVIPSAFPMEVSRNSLSKFVCPFFLQVLEKKFKDFVNEIKPLGHSKVVSLNELASKLDKEGHSKMDVIQKRTKQIHEMWEKLCNSIDIRTEVGNTLKTGTLISLQPPMPFLSQTSALLMLKHKIYRGNEYILFNFF